MFKDKRIVLDYSKYSLRKIMNGKSVLMRKLEWMIEQYYMNKENILLNINVFIFLCIIMGILLIKENKRYIINKLIHNVFYIIIIAGFGIIFLLLDLELQIDYAYFNVMFFGISVGFVLIYRIYQMIIYKKIKIPMIKCFENVKYIIFFEIFLLAVTKHLELDECVAGIFAVIFLGTIAEILKEMNNNKIKKNTKESDYPNSELYYTRQKQKERFISILEQQKSEPYAIMISSEWGMGKSSFIKAVEETLKNDVFIWIKSGSEKSVSEIMSEISEKILDVLKKNNILIEKEGVIESYFLAFSGLLDETNLSIFNKVITTLKKEMSEDAEEYLNSRLSELEKLNKTIYLIIDDLDRCGKEYQLKMFKVIRESTQLVQCKTIFLVDKQEFLGGEYKQNHIEKYVSYTLDLCKVEYREIVAYLIEDIFDHVFVYKMNPVLRKNRNVEKVRDMIYRVPEEIVQRLEKVIYDMETDNRKKDGDEKEKDTEKKQEIKETVDVINRNLSNSRKVKKFLKGIKRDIEKLNDGIEECSPEYQKEDWLKAVIEIQFIKNILPDIYAEIKLLNSILDLKGISKSNSVEIILGLNYVMPNIDEKKITILNQIIYELDIIDFAQIKLKREKYMEELQEGKAIIEHIQEYVEYAQSYDEYSEILDMCKLQEFESVEDREAFIKAILNVMSKQSSTFRVENEKFNAWSKQMISCLKAWNLSEPEKQICINEGRMIIRRVIVDNTHFLKYILMIQYGVTNVEENWQTLSVTDIDEFYLILNKINPTRFLRRMGNQRDKLLSIKKFYEILILELRKEEYKEVGVDFIRSSKELNYIFDTCEHWLNIESVLNQETTEAISRLNKYFIVERVYSFKDAAFQSVSELKTALETLKDFYELKSKEYESLFSLILLRISYRMVLLYEENPEWFGEESEEICELLTQISNMVCELDPIEDWQAKNVIDEIKIFVYKFNSYCVQEE